LSPDRCPNALKPSSRSHRADRSGSDLAHFRPGVLSVGQLGLYRLPGTAGPGQPRHVRLEPITSSKIFDDRHFFDGGTLELAHSLDGAYCGTITGFGRGDAIILDDVAFSRGEYAIWCNGKLTIYECGVALETIAISGNYERNSFAVIDAGGKAEVAF